jgi:hypothetical protein
LGVDEMRETPVVASSSSIIVVSVVDFERVLEGGNVINEHHCFVVIASAYRTDDPGFESPLGV